MSRTGANCLLAVILAVIVTGASSADSENLELIKFLSKPWLFSNQWKEQYEPDVPFRTVPIDLHRNVDPQVPFDPQVLESNMGQDEGYYSSMDNDILRLASQKRSAVATALNAGRRRRQPAPALGKVVTPYLGVGVLNDVGMFFDSLRDNLEVLASLSPQQRVSLLHQAPSVVNAPSSGGGGGGGMRRLHALRPLRPTGNIRSYNRRSFVESDRVYPGANHHDPGLLWTGLGR